MKRSLGRVLLAAAVAASAVVLPASLASATTTTTAAAGLPGCPETLLCGWSGTNFTGQVRTFRAGGGCSNAEFPLRSAANTWNGSGPGIPVILVVYSGKDCTGKLLDHLDRGESAPFLPVEGLSAYSAF
ncbi:hypothetical protein [Actinomadura sp. 9N215]|uniref:hypothetical protein n=1 Tax=Actinomadura sp. 9N215 TaxID=3375150 RepID=UPI00378F044E